MGFDAASALGDPIAAIKADRRPAKANWKGPHDPLTEADRDALVPWLHRPIAPREIARELGWHFSKVYRVADKFGLSVRGRRSQPLGDIETAVADMKPLEAVDYLLEAYRQLSGEDREREWQLIADYGLSPSQARLYAILEARAAQIVPFALLETIFDQSSRGSAELASTIRVHVHGLRRRIRAAGVPVVITSIHGVGFRLQRLEPSSCST